MAIAAGWTSCGIGHYVDDHLSVAPPVPMFPEEDTLPGSQRQAAVHERNRQTRGCERALYVGRHVVGALSRVGIQRVVLRYQAVEPGLQIILHGRVRVFLNDQARRGMADENRDEPLTYAATFDGVDDFVRNVIEPLPAGR